jgi:hypothetical protein
MLPKYLKIKNIDLESGIAQMKNIDLESRITQMKNPGKPHLNQNEQRIPFLESGLCKGKTRIWKRVALYLGKFRSSK